jgi:hypothetical protein
MSNLQPAAAKMHVKENYQQSAGENKSPLATELPKHHRLMTWRKNDGFNEEIMEEKGEIVIYQTQDGITKLDVRLDGDTVWITQEQMTLLFQRDKSTISRHIRNIFDEGELEESLVVAKNATPKKYGRREGFARKYLVEKWNS